MARITVEDCLDKVDNRFELVMVSSKRARQLQTGGKDPMVEVDNDKPTVIALREIADGHVDASILIVKPAVDVEAEFEAVDAEAAEKAEGTEGEEKPAEVEAAADDEAATAEKEETAKEEKASPEE